MCIFMYMHIKKNYYKPLRCSARCVPVATWRCVAGASGVYIHRLALALLASPGPAAEGPISPPPTAVPSAAETGASPSHIPAARRGVPLSAFLWLLAVPLVSPVLADLFCPTYGVRAARPPHFEALDGGRWNTRHPIQITRATRLTREALSLSFSFSFSSLLLRIRSLLSYTLLLLYSLSSGLSLAIARPNNTRVSLARPRRRSTTHSRPRSIEPL